MSSSDFENRKESTEELIERIKGNIKRRQQEIADDETRIAVVENVVISGELASIKGMQHSLNNMRLARSKKDQEMTQDPHSHTSMTVGNLRRR